MRACEILAKNDSRPTVLFAPMIDSRRGGVRVWSVGIQNTTKIAGGRVRAPVEAYISEARCDAATCATARFAADRDVVVERAATQGASHAAISTVSSLLFVNNSNN